MNLVYENDKIKVLNDKKETVCEVSDNKKCEYFLENWHFIKTYINTDKYVGSFQVKYQ